jgi:hypothetical protein
MQSRKTRLNLELMECRALPGTIPLAAPAPPITVIAPSPPSTIFTQLGAPAIPAVPAPTTTKPPPILTHALAGGGSGSYVCTLKYADTPSGFHFTGMAEVRGMGKVAVQADVYGVGFKTNGRAAGQITFSNAHGSVKVELLGPVQPRLSTLPEWFQYKVVSATGQYSQLRDSGTLRLSRTPDAIPIRGGLQFHETGSFRIRI